MANKLEVSIGKPKDNERVHKETIEVKGTVTPVTEVKKATLTVNERPPEPLQMDAEGKFLKEVRLREGANVIKVEAQDQQDKLWPKIRAVQYVKTGEHSFWWGAGFVLSLIFVFLVSAYIYLYRSGHLVVDEGVFRFWTDPDWKWVEAIWWSYFAVLVREIYLAGCRMDEKRFTRESAFKALGTIIQAPVVTAAFIFILFQLPIAISIAGGETTSLEKIGTPWIIAFSVVVSLFSYDTTEALRAVSRWLVSQMKSAFEPEKAAVEVSITKPEEGEKVHEETIGVKGKVTSKARVTKATLAVNVEEPSPLEMDAEGSFSKEVKLEEGWNIIKVEAENEEGKTETESIRVKYVKGGE